MHPPQGPLRHLSLQTPCKRDSRLPGPCVNSLPCGLLLDIPSLQSPALRDPHIACAERDHAALMNEQVPDFVDVCKEARVRCQRRSRKPYYPALAVSPLDRGHGPVVFPPRGVPALCRRRALLFPVAALPWAHTPPSGPATVRSELPPANLVPFVHPRQVSAFIPGARW